MKGRGLENTNSASISAHALTVTDIDVRNVDSISKKRYLIRVSMKKNTLETFDKNVDIDVSEMIAKCCTWVSMSGIFVSYNIIHSAK